jgi:hypothetical protein
MNQMKKTLKTKNETKKSVYLFVDYGIYNPAIGSHQLGPRHRDRAL